MGAGLPLKPELGRDVPIVAFAFFAHLGPLATALGHSRGRSFSSAHNAGHGTLEEVVVPWANSRTERTKQGGV